MIIPSVKSVIFNELFANNFLRCLTVSYSTKPKKFHEDIFDSVKEIRKKTEEKSFQPSKLHMIKRLRPLPGLPYWEKLILRKIGLEYETISIVKNTPSINKVLWEIKHLIRVYPITFPNGLPTEGDYTGTYLKRNGEFIISPKLKVEPERLLLDSEKEKFKMDNESIKLALRRRWHT